MRRLAPNSQVFQGEVAKTMKIKFKSGTLSPMRIHTRSNLNTL